MGYDEFIHSVIAKHQWRQFCSHPTIAVVTIDKDTINRFCGLKEADDLHTEFAINANETWLESILENIYVEGTTRNNSTQGALTIPRNNLTPQCKVWYHFLKTRLMPSTHIQTVSKDRVLLLDSIISGRPIDVAITTIAIAQITQIKMTRENQKQFPIDEEEQGPAPQATSSRNAAASSNRGPLHTELTQSLKMLEQHMSLTEDFALRKSLQKNFTKPVFSFPEFPDSVTEPIFAEENSENAEEDNEDD
ncbi:hypothetical protein TIFTF001_017207 [Ficus carica]|uniref:Putative plant transposon protein domain-containing protein n=1 Tax=Ficus carica TaxID=3494 RepID=A0AA88A4J6_FICCA|nr:hypothetical protein TIFTF001_017207 [Ficus carica]